MKCRKCGAELSDGVNFCRKCGERIDNEMRFCRECGAVLAKDAKFCSNCGARVESNSYINIDNEDKNFENTINNKMNNYEEKEPKEENKNDIFKKTICFAKIKFIQLWDMMDIVEKIVFIISLFLMVFLVRAFITKKILAIILSIIQVVALAFILLINRNVINLKNAKQIKILTIILLILSIPLSNLPYQGKKHATTKTNDNITQVNNALSENANDMQIKVRPPMTARECLGENYSEINEIFETAGFKNICLNNISDLTVDDVDLVDIVSKISIDKNSDFTLDDEFEEEAEVELTYHTLANYKLELNIEFVENWFFSTYDVDLYFNDNMETNLVHGRDETIIVYLVPGEYNIRFVNEESENVYGLKKIEITGDMNLSLKISCHSNEVEIETLYIEDYGLVDENHVMITESLSDYKEISRETYKSKLEQAGFTNIVESAIYDEKTGSSNIGKVAAVECGSNSNITRGDVLPKDAKIVIYYHECKEKSPEAIEQARIKEEISENFPENDAKKVLVVSMTNSQLNNEVKKYSDIDDFFMTLETEGNWIPKNEYTWHVDGAILRMVDSNLRMKVSCDITTNDNDYTLSNVDRIIALKENINSTDVSKVVTETFETSVNNAFLNVPSNLIDDRNEAVASEKILAKEKRQKWIEEQFSFWDNRHVELSDLIKKDLPGGKSFWFDDCQYIDIYDELQLQAVRDSFDIVELPKDINVYDLLLIQEFTYKNSAGNSCNGKSYGWVDFETDQTYLIYTDIDVKANNNTQGTGSFDDLQSYADTLQEYLTISYPSDYQFNVIRNGGVIYVNLSMDYVYSTGNNALKYGGEYQIQWDKMMDICLEINKKMTEGLEESGLGKYTMVLELSDKIDPNSCYAKFNNGRKIFDAVND